MLLSPTSNAGRTSRILLADVILWINKASLALFIARVMPRPIWSSEAVPCCRVHLLWLKHRNSKSRVGLRLHLCDWGPGINVYIDDLLPHATLELCSYWGCGQVFHYIVDAYSEHAKEGPWAVHLTLGQDWGMGRYSRYQHRVYTRKSAQVSYPR